ncbi:hypothetical protein JL101_021550 [Skermanella rosea]|uniref:hypothetical protein n=1 Tax=Skermanella rosea TaxID=1817965 RepID=UPI0019323871|nr:hypothetical protein [Skermanella rosea]UEM06736.1 hypothetical protein JL101_021550 [Skermanella rosea]
MSRKVTTAEAIRPISSRRWVAGIGAWTSPPARAVMISIGRVIRRRIRVRASSRQTSAIAPTRTMRRVVSSILA